MQPPVGPFVCERETKLDSPLHGGYLIKDGARRVVAVTPPSENSSAEATARLFVAGGNHLEKLVRALDGAEDTLMNLDRMRKEVEKVFQALDSAEDGLAPGADTKLREGALKQVEQAMRLVESWNLRDDLAPIILLDAYHRASLDLP